MEERKLRRVIFEFEDGAIEYLDNSPQCNANAWYKKVIGMSGLMSNRASDYKWDEHKWKVWNTAELIKNNDDSHTDVINYNTSHLFE